MSRLKVPETGPLEFSLLRILWKGSPRTAREVLDDYNARCGKDLKYTTIMTLLTRLVDKGVLAVDRERQPFRFRPAVSRDQLLSQRLHEFVDQFFDGRALDLAVRLVEEGELSPGGLRRLEELLRRYTEGRSGEESEGANG